MNRRALLTATGAAAAASSLPAPAIAQGIRELKLVSSFGIDDVTRIARAITESSDGRLSVKPFAAGELESRRGQACDDADEYGNDDQATDVHAAIIVVPPTFHR